MVPAVTLLGLSLALPYVVGHSLAPLVIGDPALLVLVQRRIYPFLLLAVVAVVLATMQLKQFRKLYEHIKNDRYNNRATLLFRKIKYVHYTVTTDQV